MSGIEAVVVSFHRSDARSFLLQHSRLNPQQVVFLTTCATCGTSNQLDRVRGAVLQPHQLHFVKGWGDGSLAHKVWQELSMCLRPPRDPLLEPDWGEDPVEEKLATEFDTTVPDEPEPSVLMMSEQLTNWSVARRQCQQGFHAWVPWLAVHRSNDPNQPINFYTTWCAREGCDAVEQWDCP